MREVVREYAELSGHPAPPYDCEVVKSLVPLSSDDFDLWRLLNVWHPRPAERAIPRVKHSATATGLKPSVMFVGTSFCWNILRDAGNAGVFGQTHMDYYNQTLVPWPDNGHTPVKPHTEEWRRAFLSRDLYVFDLFEGYLLAPEDTYADQFLDQVLPELQQAANGGAPQATKSESGDAQ